MVLADDAPSIPTASGDGASARPGAGWLLVVAGEGLLATHALSGAEVVIGRAEECDVVVPSAGLSRRHACLRLGRAPAVQDLGSRNGTRVAGRLLRGGDFVSFDGDGDGERIFHVGALAFVLVPATAGDSARVSSISSARPLTVLDPTLAGASRLVRDFAESGVNALILGETGVGKELLAETLHRLSRRSGEFVRVNCAAVAPALFESELFGHERGAFTGADRARAGLLEAAHGGTLLLDEVGELPLPAQAKLLRAIESGEVLRVGAVKPLPIDVRILAATHRALTSDVAAGRFRADLYFRLDGVSLVIPPLRERRAQLASLAELLLARAQPAQPTQPGRPATRLTPDVIARLEAHSWPGNVRELKAVLERALVLARGGAIGVRHLAFASEPSPPPVAGAPEWSAAEADERRRIVAALDSCAGNQTRAALKLGMARATLNNKLRLFRLPRPRK